MPLLERCILQLMWKMKSSSLTWRKRRRRIVGITQIMPLKMDTPYPLLPRNLVVKSCKRFVVSRASLWSLKEIMINKTSLSGHGCNIAVYKPLYNPYIYAASLNIFNQILLSIYLSLFIYFWRFTKYIGINTIYQTIIKIIPYNCVMVEEYDEEEDVLWFSFYFLASFYI